MVRNMHTLPRMLAVLVGIVLLTLPALADDVAQAGRDIAAKWQQTVVTVELVTKTRMIYDGEEETDESTANACGAIIDPSGLIVVSLTASSPADALSEMMDEGAKITSQVTEVRIRLADGKELPGKVVLRDKDLDLAFVRPTQQPSAPLPALDLKTAGEATLLDQVIILHRMGAVANRGVCLTLDRIQAVVEKPRPFYVPGIPAMAARLGAPVFGMDGKLIGTLAVRIQPQGTSSGGDDNGSGIGSGPAVYIVRPAADIAEAAQQAADGK